MPLNKLKQRYLAAGLCLNCVKPNPGPRKYMCPSCAKKQDESNKRAYERKKAAKLCPMCRKPTDRLNAYCTSCLEKQRIKGMECYYKTNKERKAQWQQILAKASCKCGESHPACLDFHHIDPTTKKFSISRGWRTKPWEVFLEELSKCEPMCSNCHRKLHAPSP